MTRIRVRFKAVNFLVSETFYFSSISLVSSGIRVRFLCEITNLCRSDKERQGTMQPEAS